MLLIDINSVQSQQKNQKNIACLLNNKNDPGRIIKYKIKSIKPFQLVFCSDFHYDTKLLIEV